MRKSLFIMSLTVVTLLGVTLADANLLTNGDFQMGDFTGWTHTAVSDFFGVFWSAANGTWLVDAGFNDPTDHPYHYMSQSVAVIPGMSYDITFWLKNGDYHLKDSFFEVKWGGGEGTSLMTLSNPDSFDWTQYSFTVTEPEVAPSGWTSGSLFLFFENKYTTFKLDNVSVTPSAVPEPSTMLLLGSGLIGLWGFRKKLKR